MGKGSVAQVPQDVPGSASREVFQGLFKDLGKQAMALEAILRAVCGRVDKMENWLTEVSFGMTELDLKLRNIAHNIDGTAAVDDEVPGHRWAIPPADDVKPLAPTVSKKLGADKKAVRVTGMAAAILDRLASTSANTPVPVVETEKSEKNITKKKSKEKKHGTKKVKASGLPDVPVTPSPTVVEAAPPPAIPLPAPVVEAKPTPVHDVESIVDSEIAPINNVPMKSSTVSDKVPEAQVLPVKQGRQEGIQASELPRSKGTPTPTNKENVVIDDTQESVEVDNDTETEPGILPQPVLPQIDQTKEKFVIPSVPIVTETKEKWSAPAPSISSILPTVHVEQTTQPFVLKGSAKPTPVATIPTSSPSIPTASIPDPQPVQPPVPIDTPKTIESSTSQSSQLGNSSRESSPTISPRDTNQPDESLPQAATAPEVQEPLLSSNLSTNSIAKDFARGEAEQLRPTTEPLQQPKSQPTQPVLPVVTSAINVSPDLPKTEPTKTVPVKQAPSPLLNNQPITAPESTAVVHKVLKTDGPPIRAKAASQHKAPLSPQSSEATEPAVDPLLPHRSSVHRKSSKMIQRPSFTKKTEPGADNDAAHRLSMRMRGSNSRRASLVPQVIEHESTLSPQVVQLPTQEPRQPQKPAQPAPAVQPIPQTVVPSRVDSPVDAIEQAESGEGGSDSSSGGSGGSEASSDDEEQEEDDETRAAVEEISKTMTALNKLKRAQMLSPEEEHELKERAHKKWFQLKGHIKEKQKKDVTNILLKRKKNVFTVSSRIELLEEKSREIFAALKQITHDMREKNDRSAHETLRRRVADIEQSLLSVDSRIASLSAPAIEKVSDLESEVVTLRTTVQLQLTAAQSEATARHSMLEEALMSQRTQIETLTQDVPAQLNAQTELFLEKLNQQPDYNAAIESLKRSLRRKADLKLLKELEARLLGLDAENEDCLVRCLSCHKEVTHPYNEDAPDDEAESNGSGSQLRKVNPGPSSARIYRSNVPFNAQVLVQESIVEESSADAGFSLQQLFTSPQPLQYQSAGDSYASEKAPVVRVPNVRWSAPAAEINLKKVLKAPQSSPLSLMNVTATRAILSPDRPISAPVIAPKKKAANRSKSLLKSLTPQPEPPQ